MTPHAEFLPCAEARGRPHVMLDSLPIEGTVFALSHWPSVRNPIPVASDTSTGLVFDFVRLGGDPSIVGGCAAVHFDVDGLLAVYAAIRRPPAEAEPFWRAVATAGDFRVARDANARRAACTLESVASAAAADVPGLGSQERTAQVYRHMLRWLDDHGNSLLRGTLSPFQDAAEQHYERCAALLDSSDTIIRTFPGADLTSVEIGDTLPSALAPCLDIEQDPYFGLDEFAVHERCPTHHVLVSCSARHGIVQRYEGWVQGADKAWARRPDLAALRAHLQTCDDGSEWTYNGVYQPFARLNSDPRRCSRLSPQDVAGIVADYLRIAPVGWHPHQMGLARES